MKGNNNLKNRINKLKKKKNAVILAHNYQIPDVQDIADFVGDSLGLAMKSKDIKADVIVFCGVDFMAETAKIVSPQKTVIHPDKEAACPMAAMVDVESLGWMKEEHSDAKVVAYVNTTADVKAEVDICCTSSNAVEVIKSLNQENIVFIPDKNLGLYVKRFIKDKNVILWPGICPTHHKIKPEDITSLQKKHPKAEVLVHPECRPEVIDLADYVFSTQGMINHAQESDCEEFIVGTEKELCYRLKKEKPDKTFYPLEKAICPNMKKITLERVLKSIQEMGPTVELSKEIINRAKKPIEKMFEIGRGD